MLWLIFRSVLCINYKIEHWWVYSYTETMDLEFITQRFSKEEIDCVELKLENPFEKKRLESVIKSSLVKIKKTRDKIEFKFFFDTYKNFEFLKNDHKNSIFFTEFNFNPPKIIENKLRVKYMLEKRAEKKRERIARGESDSDSDSSSEDEIKEVDCRPKILSGFIFPDRKKNERLEYRRTDYYHYQRFAPFEGSRYLETLFLQRVVNLINYIKAFPDNRIQMAVDDMRKSIASGENDEDEKRLHTRLVDLLSVISKNRRLPNLGITFENTGEKIERNSILEEFAVEIFPLVRKLEEFYDIFFSSTVEEMKRQNPTTDLSGVRSLVKDTTCYFELFDMLAYMHTVVSNCVNLPLPRVDPCPILSTRNRTSFNKYICQDYGAKIIKTKQLYITITDEDTKKPCDKNLKVLINILMNNNVLDTIEVDYDRNHFVYNFSNNWPDLADDVSIEIKGE